MMNSGQSSGGEPTVDLDSDFSADLETWINNFIRDSDFGISEDDTPINPNYHSQPLMPTADAGINFGEGSSNVQMMTSSIGMTPGSSIGPLHGSGQNILSSAIKTIANHSTAQSSQSHITTFNRYQPQQPTQTYHNQSLQPPQPTQSYHNQLLMQQGFNNNYVQQPQTHLFTNQSNITFNDQMTNSLKYQMPSNQLLFPGLVQMVNNTQTENVQSDQKLWAQMQEHSAQNPLPSQQVTGTLNDLISLGGKKRQGNINGPCDLRVPVGFATPQQFSSFDEYREYVVRQLIPVMREGYYLELQQMLSDEIQHYAQARNLEDSLNHKTRITCLETTIRFLSITKADLIPGDDQALYNYINILVNFMTNYMGGRCGGSSQKYEPLHQSFNASSVQLQNQPQMATNVETNMVNFNSRIPVTQQSRMPSSPNNTSFQRGIDRRPKNPVRIGPSIVSTSNVMIPKQQTNSGPNTSSVIGSSSPIGFLSNQAAANLPSNPLINNQQQFFNLEKMKQPMQPVHKTNEFTYSRVCAGLSPLGSRLVNHYPPNQLPVPSRVNSISQQTSVTSKTVDVNSMLAPQAITRSPYLLSSSSTPPSGKSLMTTAENQKLATPTGTPYQEPQTSKDVIHNLSQVVKSVSPKALSSSLADISLMEKVENIIPDYMPTNVVGEYINIGINNEPHPNMRREVSIPSMLNHQFDLPEGAIYSTQTITSNQKPKLENEWALLEEIKEINSKLMETIVYEVLDPSKDDISLVGGHDGVILKCLFMNVCFPDLLGPCESNSSDKMSEFAILFLVPFDYPASSTRVFKSEKDMFNCEQRWKLYEEMITRFDTATRGISGKLFVRELASNWDAIACAVMSEFSQKLGGKSFSFSN